MTEIFPPKPTEFPNRTLLKNRYPQKSIAPLALPRPKYATGQTPDISKTVSKMYRPNLPPSTLSPGFLTPLRVSPSPAARVGCVGGGGDGRARKAVPVPAAG